MSKVYVTKNGKTTEWHAYYAYPVFDGWQGNLETDKSVSKVATAFENVESIRTVDDVAGTDKTVSGNLLLQSVYRYAPGIVVAIKQIAEQDSGGTK